MDVDGCYDALSSRSQRLTVHCHLCLQLKHAKLSRQLEAATAAEAAATQRVEELQEELQDCSSTCRGRMRWLEQAAADAARRTQQLFKCLQNTAPLEVSHHEVRLCRALGTLPRVFACCSRCTEKPVYFYVCQPWHNQTASLTYSSLEVMLTQCGDGRSASVNWYFACATQLCIVSTFDEMNLQGGLLVPAGLSGPSDQACPARSKPQKASGAVG